MEWIAARSFGSAFGIGRLRVGFSMRPNAERSNSEADMPSAFAAAKSFFFSASVQRKENVLVR
jgi:hypothetical protein